MRLSRLNVAIEEAKRFLKKAEQAKREVSFYNDRSSFTPSKYVSACKRASLDLSRTLTELRRSDYEN